MEHKRRWIVGLVVLVLLVALPTAAFASKQVWRARLTTGAELHTVVNSSASGSMVIANNPDGSPRFMLTVRNLSGPAMAAHLHGPADETQNNSVVVTLCGGGPATPAVAVCTTSSDGTLTIEGNIRGVQPDARYQRGPVPRLARRRSALRECSYGPKSGG